MHRLNVLIVEDDKVTALELKRIVANLGFRSVQVAYNAEKALQAAQNEMIDLLIADIRLGSGMSGTVLACELQKRSRIATIFITAYHDDETLKAASRVEQCGYIVKPFRIEEVEAVLKIAAMRFPVYSELPKPWHYDEANRTLYKKEEPFSLPPKERLLFHLLYRANGGTVDYEQIETLLWPDGAVNDNTRRQLFYRFKRRLEGLDISIVRGEGLRLRTFGAA